MWISYCGLKLLMFSIIDGEEKTYGGCEGPDAMYVKLISSDGHEFIVKREHALTSGTIKAMLSGPGRYKRFNAFMSFFSLGLLEFISCSKWKLEQIITCSKPNKFCFHWNSLHLLSIVYHIIGLSFWTASNLTMFLLLVSSVTRTSGHHVKVAAVKFNTSKSW